MNHTKEEDDKIENESEQARQGIHSPFILVFLH